MSVLESGENYLEAILMLSKEKDGVHAIDIVNDLGFSKPSVSIMLKKLKDEGYIELRPANKKYEPIRIDEDDNFEVWGVVVWTIRNWRKY